MIQKSQTGTKWRKWSSIPCKGKFETQIFGGVRYWRPIESEESADLSEERNFETLEVGRTYMNRDGLEVAIVRYDEELAPWPFVGTGQNTHRADGCVFTSVQPRGEDLIRLLPDGKLPAKPNCADGRPDDKQPDEERNFETLEVGRTYLSRNGEEVTIVDYDEEGETWPFVGDDDHIYRADGCFFTADIPRGKDLIRLLPDCQPDGQLDSEQTSSNPHLAKAIDAQRRKERPVYSGVLKYFPLAMAEIAHCSWIGNEQHNPGTALHWDRAKSGDELDALTRHLLEAGAMDTDGVRHSTKVAWRALANLEKELEQAE